MLQKGKKIFTFLFLVEVVLRIHWRENLWLRGRWRHIIPLFITDRVGLGLQLNCLLAPRLHNPSVFCLYRLQERKSLQLEVAQLLNLLGLDNNLDLLRL